MHVPYSCLPPGCIFCWRGLQALPAILSCNERRSLVVFQVCDYVIAERGTVAFSLAAPRAGSLD